MHSGSLEKAGTPRKRTLSRGMSEDESLRHLIKEAEGSAKRLTRTNSKVGSLKVPPQGEKQAEEELITHFPEMLDLQESYDEVVQELRELEVQRETLLFQVDCLQDALEGAEEMLAEARREADTANEELERERQAKRRMEDSVDSLKEMVGALTEEIQRLKEEPVAIPTVPVYSLVTESWPEEKEEEKREGAREEGHKEDGRKEEPEVGVDALEEAALEEASEWVDALDAPLTLIRLDSTPTPLPRAETETTAGGILASFFGKGREEQSTEGGHPALHAANLGSSVDLEDDDHANGEEESPGPLTKLQMMFNKTFGQTAAVRDEAPSREGEASRGGAEPLPGSADSSAGETPMATPDESPQTATGLGSTPPPQQDVPTNEDRQGSENGDEDGAHPPGDPLGLRDGAELKRQKSDSCVVS